MQPIDLNYYNTNYQRAYEYAAIGLGGHNQSSLIPAPSTAGQLYYGFPNGVVQQDWGRPMDTYTHIHVPLHSNTIHKKQHKPNNVVSIKLWICRVRSIPELEPICQ
ncbi:hypothetical protein KIN20_038372 [Parelaphostrongylus tenuis]|uniref:Uncharacterized protein n=1 Tax=Parelaphostrongylus tenuis TaxID=148309 RepID=A0AAD5MAW6_PARTN|nr:hypothetical protein KIN20_038372 [Parelaphostrongylus tenuis]